MLTGVAVGVATITLKRHVGRLAATPTALRRAFSWFSLAPAASNGLGPLGAGLMIDWAGFRAAFLLLAALAIVSWLLMRRLGEQRGEHEAAAAGTPWNLWRDASFRRLMLMNALFMASWDLHGFMVPVLGSERGLDASVIGGILGTFAITAAMVRVVMPIVAARLREWVLITAATAITGVVFGLYPLTASAVAMGLCSALIGAALGGSSRWC